MAVSKLHIEDQPAKLTWREIRERIEQAGVSDADEIDCIEISWGTLDQLSFTKDQDFGWQIRQSC
ncbi:MAG: hypothetical protein HY272_04105 [Gammaproteobacteria bacterium]|nr:hypothetical protein [Gammaproteobacteria bacterium]